MGSRLLALIALGIGVLVTAGPLSAHHGTASYDTTKTVTVSGTVTEFKFVNPHVLIYWEVKDDMGNVERWIGERSGPNSLARNAGWTAKTIKPGDQVTITGRRSKNGSPAMAISKIILNGKELSQGDGDN
jgi:DNA/RNA endonuclease YhcR with UshA esterase domain